jgi:hypothetical protein
MAFGWCTAVEGENRDNRVFIDGSKARTVAVSQNTRSRSRSRSCPGTTVTRGTPVFIIGAAPLRSKLPDQPVIRFKCCSECLCRQILGFCAGGSEFEHARGGLPVVRGAMLWAQAEQECRCARGSDDNGVSEAGLNSKGSKSHFE